MHGNLPLYIRLGNASKMNVSAEFGIVNRKLKSVFTPQIPRLLFKKRYHFGSSR